MRPFFSYLGSKWQLAKTYGPPRYETVVEPFAGSAAYSVRWEPKNAILIDLNPRIVGVWDYLIHATEEEVRALPLDFDTVDDLDVCDGAKWLIGFWINRGNVEPCKKPGAWARQYRHSGDAKVWGEAARERIASQLHKIRGWETHLGSYQESPYIRAQWFIDPPYQVAGKNYTFSDIDYEELADWCWCRTGHAIVCENEGANWLPFEHVKDQRGTFGKTRSGVSKEVAWSALL
jgi:hypothetical protein